MILERRLPVNYLSRNTKNSPRLIIDTSTFFSALYNEDGNEAHLFDLADEGLITLYIPQYVIDELIKIMKRKKFNHKLIFEFLERINNVFITDIEDITKKEINLSIELISDRKDRPIFIYVLRMIKEEKNVYFVTGDKIFFKPKVKKALKNRVLRTREFIDMIQTSAL